MDDGRVSYEEAAEAIRNWIKAVYDCPDDYEDVTILYANEQPVEVVRESMRNTLTTYELELQRRVVIGNFMSVDDVARLLCNGDITLSDTRIWCFNTNHSLSDMEQAIENIRYGQTEISSIPDRHEKKRPWPYHLVAFLNEVVDMFVNVLLEDFI